MSTSSTTGSTGDTGDTRPGPAPGLSGAAWRKSSHSNGATNCVEVAMLPDGTVGVRHSHRPDETVIVYSRSEWAAFVAGVKGEEFEVGPV